MSVETDLGEVIKKIRSIEGLTQERLAEILDVSQSAIGKRWLAPSKSRHLWRVYILHSFRAYPLHGLQ